LLPSQVFMRRKDTLQMVTIKNNNKPCLEASNCGLASKIKNAVAVTTVLFVFHQPTKKAANAALSL
jgi:hypothetical protein